MKSLAKLPSVPESSFPDTEQSIQSEQPVNTPSVAPGSKYNLKTKNKTAKYSLNKFQREIPEPHFIVEAVGI